MIRSLKEKKYFVSFLVTKSHSSNFLHLYISCYFMKIKKQRPAEAIPCLVWTRYFFFFSLFSGQSLGEASASHSWENTSFSSLFGFRAMWVSVSLGSVSAPSWKSGSRKSTTQPCLLDFAFSVENTGSDDYKGVCGRCWLTSLQFLWKDDLIGTTVTLF